MATRTKTGDPHFDSTTEAVEEMAAMVACQEQIAANEQEQHECMIAELHEKIGQIRAADVFYKFADVSSLVWLKQVKDSGIYKQDKSIGTWEKFCESIGLSRQHVDERIRNLDTLGENFLLTVSSMSVGYRELRKLRHMKNEGALEIESNAIKIGEEQIPIDDDHAEDLQAAIETLLEKKDSQIKEQNAVIKAKDRILQDKERVIIDQEQDLTKYKRSLEEKGFAPGEEDFLRQISKIKTEMIGCLSRLDPEALDLEGSTARMQAAYLEILGFIRRWSAANYDTAIDLMEMPDLDDDWTPPNERQGYVAPEGE